MARISEKLIIDYQRGENRHWLRCEHRYSWSSVPAPLASPTAGIRLIATSPPVIEGVEFPVAAPLVMAAERTFWEKATAAHVYSLQGRLRGERYSRHWYDLAAMKKTGHVALAAGDRHLARAVAEHKSVFFAEKDANGSKVDYLKAVTGRTPVGPRRCSIGCIRKRLQRDVGGRFAGASSAIVC